MGFAPLRPLLFPVDPTADLREIAFFLIGRAPGKEVFFSLGAGAYRSYFGQSTTYRILVVLVDKMIYL